MSRKQEYDKYDRPTIHHFLRVREEAIRETYEAAIADAKDAQPKPEPVDFDDMPLNYEEREYEKMLDYQSFLAGDEQ